MPADAQAELLEAIAAEGRGHRALLDGDAAGGREAMRAAAGHYRASWEAAPPSALGRLVGMLKATVIAGGGEAEAAAYARAELPGDAKSPTASYVRAIAALIDGDDDEAAAAAAQMPGGSPAFARTAAAIGALARRDGAAYAEAVDAILADFAARDAHLTGVPIADTALMLERLAAPRGLACRPRTPLLPPDGGADA